MAGLSRDRAVRSGMHDHSNYPSVIISESRSWCVPDGSRCMDYLIVVGPLQAGRMWIVWDASAPGCYHLSLS